MNMRNIKRFLIIFFVVFFLFISIPTYIRTSCNILPLPTPTFLGLPWKKIPCKYTGVMWGPSLVEYGLMLKHHIDKNGFYFFGRAL